jgi:uncharacterized protein YndB with AHSA1/START domain
MTASDATVLQDDELLIERVLDAPPGRVFEVWTTPEHLMRWWGPKDFTTTAFEQDFRVGGGYRACIRSPAGSDNWMSGAYREIVPEKKIVMTFKWENSSGGDLENVITVTFAQLAGGRTLFRFHQAPFATVEARDSHLGGWSELVDNLVAYLSTEAL